MPVLNKEERQVITAEFKKISSTDRTESEKASANIAEAIATPLRETLLSGDIVGGIFTPQDWSDNPRVEYPTDLLTPGEEREHYAYVMPGEGRIPERRVEADYLMVPTYRVANSIDCTLRFIRDANWPVLQRMMEVFEAGFVKKMNDDGWQTILAAAVDRNLLINDPNASVGQFTPRLVTLLSTFMRRNGGGNSATLGRSKLTDIFISPEAQQDIRAWNLDQVADEVRKNIFYANDTDQDLIKVFGVNVHALDEFGEGQDYQRYYTTDLGASMAGSDVEIGVGLDLQREDSFVNPVRQGVQVYEDNTVHRRGLFSIYGDAEMGWACLDSRRVTLLSV